MNRTYGETETKQIADLIIEDILASDQKVKGGATVVGLTGDLGAGKTTLVKEIARVLGVKDVVTSPTYVILKSYETSNQTWQRLVHIDAYRIENILELGPIGWENLLTKAGTLIVVEWPERIRGAMPEGAINFEIEHLGESRHIKSI